MAAEEDRFVKEFQRRRVRMLRCLGFSMMLIIVALGLLQLSGHSASFLSIASRHWRAIGISQFAAAMVFAVIGFSQYRCPSCNEIVKGHDKYYLGIVLDPPKCPSCGRRLK
jgi:hypothetical protein